MKLKLIAPVSSMNWMLMADDIADPEDWSLFLLNHGPDTERYQLERAVEKSSDEKPASLVPYRLRWKRGQAAFEYLWQTEASVVKAHAGRVAEILSIDLELPESGESERRAG